MIRDLEYELFGGPRDVGRSETEADLEWLQGRADDNAEMQDLGSRRRPQTITVPSPAVCNTTPVTRGEFGTALLWYTNTFCVPNEVGLSLPQSPTFMRMAHTLDRRYLFLNGTRVSHPPRGRVWWSEWNPRDDGVLTTGPYRGRRLLAIWIKWTGSYFSPAGSPENQFGYDLIFLQPPAPARSVLQPPTIEEIGQWIAVIAHETTHAFHHVTRTGSGAATMTGRVRESIAEEGATRRTEATIVAEIQRRVARLRAFRAERRCVDQACRGLVDATDGAAIIERDFFPSDLSRTYLEQFVMMELIREAIRRENLTATDIDHRDAEVNRIELTASSLDSHLETSFPRFFDPQMQIFRSFTSDYSKLRFWLRVIDGRWRRFMSRSLASGQDFEAAKERVLQEHAHAFFGQVSAYTPLPSQRP